MRVERSTFLPCSAERCIDGVMRPKLLMYIARPLVKFVPKDPPTLPARWQERAYRVRMLLFGVLPFGDQTIGISVPKRSDTHFELRDNGSGSMISRWDHCITIQSAEGGCLYSDRVEIEAGPLTPFVWAFAWLFFRHRQKRWLRLVGNGFQYD